MSSDEILLRAQGLTKSFLVSPSPTAKFFEALLGSQGRRQVIPVLNGIDLEIRRGETVGILGRNGAGKTTLLSILGGVIEPTAGRVEVFGKVAILLGVSAGFSPERTGRENAESFCNIMGFGREERRQILPRIEAFADIGPYFDRPFRTYSSGMQARVAFACGCQVSADLIIVDETLAVGDAEFRMKCYSLIEARQRQGQTYLIVSHSPGVVANYCTRAIVLHEGAVQFDGLPREAIEFYKQLSLESRKVSTKLYVTRNKQDPDEEFDGEPENPKLELVQARLENATDEKGGVTTTIALLVRANLAVREPVVRMALRDSRGIGITGYRSDEREPRLGPLSPGQVLRLDVAFDNRLVSGRYWVRVGLYSREAGVDMLSKAYESALSFEVSGARRGGLVDLGMRIVAVEVRDSKPSSLGADRAWAN